MRFAFFLVCMLFGSSANAAADQNFKAGTFDPPREAPDFTLTGSDGSPLKLSRYRGRVVVLGFGFTSCPDVCPTTLAVLAQARKKLGARSSDVQVVYVTVDPKRDNAEQMRRYLASFDRTFVGGTGTPEQLAEVRRQYGILAERKSAENSYAIAHSSYTYLIDREGKLRALMPFGRSADDYSHDIRILLGK